MRNFLMTVTFMLASFCLAWSQKTPNITFVQQTNVVLNKGTKGYYEINLKPEPFRLIFEGKELMVCVGLDEKLFERTKAGTDINADYSSDFYIFKYAAASPDADHLVLGNGGGNSLNGTHGAKPHTKTGFFHYTVRTLHVDRKAEPIERFKQFFMALWLDKNKDQFIDKEELLHVKVNVK